MYDTPRKKSLALLIPAHNEQLVIAGTIRSAIRAGQPREDIYVVSDGSSDWTADLARLLLGATCILRTDILDKLDFTRPSLTEDMDLTLQIHRQKLGKIVYIPQVRAFTQDPKDFGDYFRQVLRWYRGGWQVMQRHHVGLRPRRIDAYMSWMILQEIVLLLEVTLLPLLSWWSQNYGPMALLFLYDLAAVFAVTLWAAILNRRPDIIRAFPLFYFLRLVNLIAFFKAWFEVVILRKFSSNAPGWSTDGRRYVIEPSAVN
jgi:cellulose synthase/poly-beta-1,6-N-acetylglucosamine synthase-like glycosyltransferase